MIDIKNKLNKIQIIIVMKSICTAIRICKASLMLLIKVNPKLMKKIYCPLKKLKLAKLSLHLQTKKNNLMFKLRNF